jgi:hypothetical protein
MSDIVSGAVMTGVIIISFLSLMSFADFLRVHWQQAPIRQDGEAPQGRQQNARRRDDRNNNEEDGGHEEEEEEEENDNDGNLTGVDRGIIEFMENNASHRVSTNGSDEDEPQDRLISDDNGSTSSSGEVDRIKDDSGKQTSKLRDSAAPIEARGENNTGKQIVIAVDNNRYPIKEEENDVHEVHESHPGNNESERVDDVDDHSAVNEMDEDDSSRDNENEMPPLEFDPAFFDDDVSLDSVDDDAENDGDDNDDNNGDVDRNNNDLDPPRPDDRGAAPFDPVDPILQDDQVVSCVGCENVFFVGTH